MKNQKTLVPFVAVVFDWRGRATASKPGSVEIRVTMARESKYYPTGVRVYPGEFKNGKVVNRADQVALNERVSIFLRKVERFIAFRLDEEGKVTFPEIADLFRGENDSPFSFYDFCVERSRSRIVEESTRKRYFVFLRNLREYGKILAFSDLTTENIIIYNEWLSGRGISFSGIYNYHKVMKLFIEDAIRFGKIAENPYKKLPKGYIKKGERENTEYLTSDEVQKIETAELATERLNRARDLFLFQCYTGMAFADLMKFDFNDYSLINGYYVFTGARQKTGVKFTSVLLPQAVKIAEKYCCRASDSVDGVQGKSGKIPTVCNADYNRALKLIAAEAGITKRMHSHLARHTFATLMLGHGVAVENVARMLGHASLRQTQHYAKVLEANIVNDVVKNALGESEAFGRSL